PPKWIEKSDWDKLPNSLRVREITLNMRAKGFRTEKITIVTTILDETIPAKEWAELYFHRWKVEVQFRDIKITMGMDILKAKSPRMIEKEVHMYFIAYNLIRLLMQRAAVENSADLSKMSFKAAARAILVWGPILAKQETDEDFDETLRYFLKTISYPRCRNRKNRTEPRAKKRRPKNYQLLQGDRHHFKEIGHRSKYRKLA
ncbi:MAG TPA: transposase, partial [Alphaproteobacteria bacterium]|nr:transposase [Alphaproteobacteria bacterium]